MWDPRTYEDTDYGLDEGESFEPEFDPSDEPPFDRTQPHIMTLLGPIEPEELGVCIPATRFLPPPSPGQSERQRTRFLAEAADELEAFASVGGRSVVDTATASTGRDLLALQRLTQLVPSHLIAAAGVVDRDTDPAASIAGELDRGLDGSGIEAGLIAVKASEHRASGEPVGVARLALERGMALLVELESWDEAGPVLDGRRGALSGRGPQDCASLILAGPDSLPDTGLVAEAASVGGFVTLRTPGSGHPRAEAALAETLVSLSRQGLAGHVLVTLDLVTPTVRVAGPSEPRAPYLIDRLALAMMNAGASALDVRQVMIENPARALTILPPVAE
ncbi:MAG: hypothetical protein ACTHMX_14505 [Thermomicrobiales bacterium]